jgi:hypothetical protein
MYVAHEVSKRRNKNGEFEEIGSINVLARRLHGLYGEILTIVMLFIVQFSCCVGYIYFVATQIE